MFSLAEDLPWVSRLPAGMGRVVALDQYSRYPQA
jgi:hypothetical protein